MDKRSGKKKKQEKKTKIDSTISPFETVVVLPTKGGTKTPKK
jgi:hypothetical protein